ncbi:MAG TPA: arylamine N-acetyltransferase [Burkholderiales bacterium]|nr:arylamine N-acetyltransferase [Burkholderiales bacterium]
MLDLPAYLQRIGYGGDRDTDEATLGALHLAHATRIPFENLDILLGQPISLGLDRLQEKLVQQRRGGYCFEQNKLFAAVLRDFGFPVTALAARVRQRQSKLLPRTHMCLLVHAGGHDWIADVGFGGEGLLQPVPMTGAPVRQFLWTYRVLEETPGAWVLQSQRGDNWNDLYAFSLEPQEDVDLEMANYYVSTHPDSRFVRTLTVQLPTPGRRQILRNRELMTDSGDELQSVVITSDEELLQVLSQNFDLNFPAGTRFCFQEEENQP